MTENPASQICTSALKEWAIATQALAQGETILLLRKGGIREKEFAISQRQFWLYPTYEHQQPLLLKPQYGAQVQPVASGWHPEDVEIQAWAELTHYWQTSAAKSIEALLPFHIWNTQFIVDRLQWQPQRPISILLLRVHRLPQPQKIIFRSEYRGCKSWIELQAEIPTSDSRPVLSEKEYLNRVQNIQGAIA